MRSDRLNAFSLIEVTISLGIVAFALVGILGALPLAMGNGRYSVEQTRAASIASTLFASFRSQPFTKVYYLSEDGSGGRGTPVNLATDHQNAGNAIPFYAKFTDGSATGEALQFQSGRSGAEYAVTLGYNHIAGSKSGGADLTGAIVAAGGIANQVEVDVYALDHPKDVYRYVSVIANRAQ